MRTLLGRAVPVPVSNLATLAVGTGSAVALHSSPYYRWPYSDWPAVSAEAHECLLLVGPWVAGCCAWVAARFASRRSLLCPPSAIRSGRTLIAAQLTALVVTALVSFSAALAPLFTVTALRATTGAVDVLSVIASIFALTALCCTGYLLGAALPLVVAPLAAAISAYAVTLFSGALGPVLSPAWTFGVLAGQYENPAVSLQRGLFFAVWAGSCAAVAALLLRARTTVVTAISLAPLLVLVPAVGVATLLVQAPVPVLNETAPAVTCTNALDTVEVCTHSAKEPLLEPFASAVAAVLAPYGPAAPVRRVVESGAQADAGGDTLVISLQVQMGPVWPDVAAEDIAWLGSGAGLCAANSPAGMMAADDASLDRAAVSAAVAVWLADQAGLDAAALPYASAAGGFEQRLLAAPDGRVRQFLVEEAGRLSACQTPSSALP